MAGMNRVGAVLGGAYRIERLIGEGGMGSVFEASHLRLPRRFAVKLLNPEVLGNREVFERFQREAEIASSLGDEHIVQVFDFNFTEDGVPFMVLELLQGEDLAARIARRGRLPVHETAILLEQLAGALEVAHQHGIVHRDLKPQNIFMCRTRTRDDFVKILDFGISKILYSGQLSTKTGAVMGTPNYMSPEQAEGRQSAIDSRTDLFALGSILYECLTGRMAFRADSMIGAVYQVCHGTPEPIRQLAPEVNEQLEWVLMRAMAKRVEDRYQDVGSLRDDFLRAAGMPVTPRAGGQPMTPPPIAVAGPKSRTTLSNASGQSQMNPAAGGGKGKWVAGALVAAGVAGALVFALTRGGKQAETETGAGTGSGTAAAPVDPKPEPEPRPEQKPDPVAQPAAQIVKLTLDVGPPGAIVELNGVATSANPIELPKGDRTHKLVVSAKGYVSQTREVVALMDGSVRIHLEKDEPRPQGKIKKPVVPTPVKEPEKKIKVQGPVEKTL